MSLKYGLQLSLEEVYKLVKALPKAERKVLLAHVDFHWRRMLCKSCYGGKKNGQKPPKECEACYLDEEEDKVTVEDIIQNDEQIAIYCLEELYPDVVHEWDCDSEVIESYVPIPVYQEEEAQVIPPFAEVKAKFTTFMTQLDALKIRYRLDFF